MTTTADKPAQDFKVVGTRPIRHDGVDKVTGRAAFGADARQERTLREAALIERLASSQAFPRAG